MGYRYGHTQIVEGHGTWVNVCPHTVYSSSAGVGYPLRVELNSAWWDRFVIRPSLTSMAVTVNSMVNSIAEMGGMGRFSPWS